MGKKTGKSGGGTPPPTPESKKDDDGSTDGGKAEAEPSPKAAPTPGSAGTKGSTGTVASSLAVQMKIFTLAHPEPKNASSQAMEAEALLAATPGVRLAATASTDVLDMFKTLAGCYGIEIPTATAADGDEENDFTNEVVLAVLHAYRKEKGRDTRSSDPSVLTRGDDGKRFPVFATLSGTDVSTEDIRRAMLFMDARAERLGPTDRSKEYNNAKYACLKGLLPQGVAGYVEAGVGRGLSYGHKDKWAALGALLGTPGEPWEAWADPIRLLKAETGAPAPTGADHNKDKAGSRPPRKTKDKVNASGTASASVGQAKSDDTAKPAGGRGGAAPSGPTHGVSFRCYSCNEVGHKQAECPNRAHAKPKGVAAGARADGTESGVFIEGNVGGVAARLKIDEACDVDMLVTAADIASWRARGASITSTGRTIDFSTPFAGPYVCPIVTTNLSVQMRGGGTKTVPVEIAVVEATDTSWKAALVGFPAMRRLSPDLKFPFVESKTQPGTKGGTV